MAIGCLSALTTAPAAASAFCSGYMRPHGYAATSPPLLPGVALKCGGNSRRLSSACLCAHGATLPTGAIGTGIARSTASPSTFVESGLRSSESCQAVTVMMTVTETAPCSASPGHSVSPSEPSAGERIGAGGVGGGPTASTSGSFIGSSRSAGIKLEQHSISYVPGLSTFQSVPRYHNTTSTPSLTSSADAIGPQRFASIPSTPLTPSVEPLGTPALRVAGSPTDSYGVTKSTGAYSTVTSGVSSSNYTASASSGPNLQVTSVPTSDHSTAVFSSSNYRESVSAGPRVSATPVPTSDSSTTVFRTSTSNYTASASSGPNLQVTSVPTSDSSTAVLSTGYSNYTVSVSAGPKVYTTPVSTSDFSNTLSSTSYSNCTESASASPSLSVTSVPVNYSATAFSTSSVNRTDPVLPSSSSHTTITSISTPPISNYPTAVFSRSSLNSTDSAPPSSSLHATMASVSAPPAPGVTRAPWNCTSSTPAAAAYEPSSVSTPLSVSSTLNGSVAAY